MKKTLNNIFDEAKAHEIEILVNKNPAFDIPTSTLASIKKKVYDRTGLTKPKRIKRRKLQNLRWQPFVAVVVCIAIFFSGIVAAPYIMRLLGSTQPPQILPGVTDPLGTSADTTGNKDVVTNKPPSLEDINNGVLQEASPESMSVPENMKKLGTGGAKEDNNSSTINATVVQYTLDGDVVNWTTENDLIYVITANNNRLVIIDSKNLTPIYNTPLAGIPAEMNIIGDRIYISFPDLCRIDSFSKANCEKEGSLSFDHEVSSFCFDGNYIYYSEHDQHCDVFRRNLVTGELEEIRTENIYGFWFPKLYLNKEDRILYVGETNTSGGCLYYFDADTLALKSVFEKNNYGTNNTTREIFHIDNEIYWAGYRISDTNAKELIGKYGTSSSMVFVSKELVATYEGLFLADTYECVIDYFDAKFPFECVLVSESYNVFFRARSGYEKNIIIGLNFEIQEVSEAI